MVTATAEDKAYSQSRISDITEEDFEDLRMAQ
jgi:hypothetical protein